MIPWREALEAVSRTLFVSGPRGGAALQELFERHRLRPGGLCAVTDPWQGPDAARQALQSLDASRGLRYVCIVGGWDEVAPYQYPNPSFEYHGDEDELCYSDAPYGHRGHFDETELECVFPEIAVGRVPTCDVAVLERVLLAKPQAQDARKALAFAVSAEVWTGATMAVVEAFLGRKDAHGLLARPAQWAPSGSPRVLLSPQWEEPHLATLVSKGGLAPGAILLFNVHGSDSMTAWVGDGAEGYPQVFSPAAVADFKGAVLVTEACYGGKLDYDEPGMAQTLFARGGKAFVGCSMIAWGSSSTPSDADLIALGFLESIHRGEEFGLAMRQARQRVLQAMDPSDTATAEKTILSFNFYGAPWDRLGSGVSGGATGTSLLERTRASMATAGHHRALPKLEEIRERYMGRLGDRGRRFLLEREEARATFESFAEAARIARELEQFGLRLEECRMESVQREGVSSFHISGKTAANTPVPMGVLVVVDANGRLVSTKTTKTIRTTRTVRTTPAAPTDQPTRPQPTVAPQPGPVSPRPAGEPPSEALE